MRRLSLYCRDNREGRIPTRVSPSKLKKLPAQKPAVFLVELRGLEPLTS